MDALARRLADGDLAVLDAHAAALDRWLALGGDDADPRLDAAAGAAGLDPALLDRPLRALSGGQAARAGLAALATARLDVVLLDEPTTHLDEDGLAHLRALLDARDGGHVVVSHDRALLADVAATLVELDPRTGRATAFAGGWDAYERERDAARLGALRAHEAAVADRRAVEAKARELRRRSAVMESGLRRRPKDNDKHGREWVRMRAQEQQGRARKLAGRAARIDVPDKPFEHEPLRLDLTAAERRRPWVVALEGAVLRRGSFALGPMDLALADGDRLLVTGRNGSGKSTLLSALAGELELAGGVRRVADGAVVARLGQEREALRGEDASLAAAVAARTGRPAAEARAALALVGLGAEVADRPPATLSPGELTRAELAVLAQRRAACLVLDEPTNHLDVASLELLERALDGWPGALIVATHDARLRDALRTTRVLAL